MRRLQLSAYSGVPLSQALSSFLGGAGGWEGITTGRLSGLLGPLLTLQYPIPHYPLQLKEGLISEMLVTHLKNYLC